MTVLLHPGICVLGCIACTFAACYTGRAAYMAPALGCLVLTVLVVTP